MKKKPKNKRITKKQALLVAEIKRQVVDPDREINISAAGRAAGYLKRQDAHQALHSPTVQDALGSYLKTLEDVGVNDLLAAEQMLKGLTAKKKSYFQHEGKVTDYKVDDDHVTRHKYLDSYHKLKQFVSGGGEQPINDNRKQLVIVLGNNGKSPLEDII